MTKATASRQPTDYVPHLSAPIFTVWQHDVNGQQFVTMYDFSNGAMAHYSLQEAETMLARLQAAIWELTATFVDDKKETT